VRRRIQLIGSDNTDDNPLATHLRGLGYEVLVLEEPEDCPVYHGKSCPLDQPCCDFFIIDQFLTSREVLDYVDELSRKCSCRIGKIALLAAVLSPDELVKAIELGCKVMFKPVLPREVEEWLLEVESGQSRESIMHHA